MKRSLILGALGAAGLVGAAALAQAQVITTPAFIAMACAFNTVVPTPVSGQFFYVQCDSTGRLLTTASGLQSAGSTVAAIPACTGALVGTRRHVTDATAPTFLGALTGGGAVVTPVFCNGTAWVAG